MQDLKLGQIERIGKIIMLRKIRFLFLAITVVIFLNTAVFGWGIDSDYANKKDFVVQLTNNAKVSFPVEFYKVQLDKNKVYHVSGVIKNDNKSKKDFSNSQLSISLLDDYGNPELFHTMKVSKFKYGDVANFEFSISRDINKFSSIINYIFVIGGSKLDLSKAMDFATYKKTATSEELFAIEKKVMLTKPSEFFIEGIKKIDKPMTLLLIGTASCPNSLVAYPYMEATMINPLIKTKYFPQDITPGAKEYAEYRTERTNTPVILVIFEDENDGWYCFVDAYSETPKKVTELLENTKSKEEKDVIWKDFHKGVYNEDIQRQILEMLEEGREIL